MGLVFGSSWQEPDWYSDRDMFPTKTARRQIEVDALLKTVREFCAVKTCLCESDLLCWKCLMADKLRHIDAYSVD